MRQGFSIIVVFVVALIFPQIVQAQETTYLSNLGQASIGSVAAGSNSWLAADIITGNNVSGYIFNSAQLAMSDASGNPNNFTVMLYSATTSTGVKPGSNLGTLAGSTNPSTTGIYTYTDDSNIILSPNTDYFIVLTAGTAVTNGAYEWSLTDTYSYNSSSGWGVGSDEGIIAFFLTSNNGSSWNADEGNIQFAINATPIPEPSSEMLLGLGGILLLGFGRWKAKAVE